MKLSQRFLIFSLLFFLFLGVLLQYDIQFMLHLFVNLLAFGTSPTRVILFVLLAMVFYWLFSSSSQPLLKQHLLQWSGVFFALYGVVMPFVAQFLLIPRDMPPNTEVMGFFAHLTGHSSVFHIHALKASIYALLHLFLPSDVLMGYDTGATYYPFLPHWLFYLHLLVVAAFFFFLVQMLLWLKQKTPKKYQWIVFFLFLFSSFGILVNFFDAGYLSGQLPVHLAVFLSLLSFPFSKEWLQKLLLFLISLFLLMILGLFLFQASTPRIFYSVQFFLFLAGFYCFFVVVFSPFFGKSRWRFLVFFLVMIFLLFFHPYNKGTLKHQLLMLDPFQSYSFVSSFPINHSLLQPSYSSPTLYVYALNLNTSLRVYGLYKLLQLSPFYEHLVLESDSSLRMSCFVSFQNITLPPSFPFIEKIKQRQHQYCFLFNSSYIQSTMEIILGGILGNSSSLFYKPH